MKAGSITFNRAGGVDCRVRNLSPVGACLEVASQIGIPDEFVLVVEVDHVKAPCHVIWRTATRLGVEFDAAAAARAGACGRHSADDSIDTPLNADAALRWPLFGRAREP